MGRGGAADALADGKGKSLFKMRKAVKTVSMLKSAEDNFEVDEYEKSEKAMPVPPPAINKTQRPLRRRTGPTWACVLVDGENDESGPYESAVRCRFCGAEWLSDEARVKAHVKNLQKPVDLGLLPDFSLTGFLDGPAPAPTPADAAPMHHPDVVEPPPPCTADLTSSSAAEHELAMQWMADYDFLQFALRVGVSITSPIARAMRRAEVAESRALLYPTKAHVEAGAAAAREAVEIVRHAAMSEWQSVDRLVFVGCGLGDDDCTKIISLMRSSGALRELREFSLAQNLITDVGFTALCREVITPPDARGSSATGSYSDLAALGDSPSKDDASSQDPYGGTEYDARADALEAQGILPSLLGNRLTSFSTFRNPISDKGLAALADALDKGGLPQLAALNVSGSALVNPDGTPRSTNVIERERARRLHAARLLASRSGGSPGGGMAEQDGSEEGSQDHSSSLDVGIGDEGIKKFAYRLHHNKPTPGKPGMLTQLKDLRLFGNSIGDDGLIALSMAFSERSMLCRNLQNLWLQNNFIADRGLCFMVDTLFNGGMVNLRRLLLADNCISHGGGEALALALGRGALAKLRKLSLGGNALGEDSINHLSSCLVERTYSLGGASTVEIDLIPSNEAELVASFGAGMRMKQFSNESLNDGGRRKSVQFGADGSPQSR